MKIKKRRTVTEMEGGATVEQTAWQPIANALVQCEFEAEYPVRSSGLRSVTGAMGIFLGKQVERIRFILAPRNILQSGAPAYGQMDLNFLNFEGEFLGSDNVAFTNNLTVKPTFDEGGGWEFEFAEATDAWNAAPGKFDEQVRAEVIAANCICTEAFKVSIGRRSPGTITGIFAQVILRDIEGLRQAISDIAGEAYLNRLLRMHGYVIDRDEPTQ
jgi:hypothetical protein